MKSSLCIIHRKRTASLGIVGLMLTIAPLGLILALANRSAQAQTSADLSTAPTTPASSPGDWTQFLTDNMQRWNPYETLLGVSNVGTLQVKWSYPIGSNISASSPAVADGIVYFGSTDHNVYALNAGTGAKLWSYTTGDQVYSSPAVANGVVFVGSMDSNVYALNANTGAKLWSFATDSSVDSSPAVVNGVVYIVSVANGGTMYALNANTGAKLWSFDTFSTQPSSASVVNGIVYFADGWGALYALNANTGAQLWRFIDAGGDFAPVAPPTVANGVVYVCNDATELFALNASTGAKLWNYSNGVSGCSSSPTVANGVVYVVRWGGPDGLDAVNASTGAKLWSVPT
jgi:outer membrane protein assembly factor BamB